MCTVACLPNGEGYVLGMNRDESVTRPIGRAPGVEEIMRAGGPGWVISPADPAGGTWISLNDQGVTLALINWYSVPPGAGTGWETRGRVVRDSARAANAGEVDAVLAGLPWERLQAFRLIGVFPAARVLHEWSWDRVKLRTEILPWAARLWVSSGWDEPRAQVVRGETFAAARAESGDTNSLAWLRRFQRSHAAGPGPFSVCMHRADAHTVSYTEIEVTAATAALRYHAGSPCEPAEAVEVRRPRGEITTSTPAGKTRG